MWDYIYKDRIGMLMGQVGFPLVLIRAGAGGSFSGYQDKYLRLAERLCGMGYSVISSSNCTTESFREMIELAAKIKEQLQIERVYYIGVSLGALQGIYREAESPSFSKLVLVNPPLMENYHNKTYPSVKKIACDTVFVFGEKDPSANYVPFLKVAVCDQENVSVKMIPGADHNFKGMTDEWIDLAVGLLSDDR